MFWWGLGALVLLIVVGIGWWFLRELLAAAGQLVRASELQGRSAAELAAQIERILAENRADEARSCEQIAPGILAFPSPAWRRDGGRARRALTLLPALFHERYYGAEVSEQLDDPDTREVVVEAALAIGRDPSLSDTDLYDLVDLYEGDVREAPRLDRELDYRPGDRVLSLLLIDVAHLLSAGASLEELRARWGLSDDAGARASLEEKRLALAGEEARAMAAAIEREHEILDAAGADRAVQPEDVRPRFFTPGRRARHDALIHAVMQQEGVEASAVEAPSAPTLEVPGLPFPIDFVADLGTHVMPLHDTTLGGERYSMEQLRALALDNLRGDGRLPRLPHEVRVFEDPRDHGAAYVLLLPELLGEDETLLVLAPSQGALVLFPDDPAFLPEAREAFDALFEAGGGDAPIPQPVRVSQRGFELARVS